MRATTPTKKGRTYDLSRLRDMTGVDSGRYVGSYDLRRQHMAGLHERLDDETTVKAV